MPIASANGFATATADTQRKTMIAHLCRRSKFSSQRTSRETDKDSRRLFFIIQCLTA